ncbi:hypothetical protein [Flavihumibacter sp. CACIAM 22H1]|uniref:hypothetical protein n=1 Tax=Flavihumibacter sp. CACIAM 22H1 TaxID=1812911 RepID=UPI0007A92515|nr:hypothetical protein [Flavihumibacter sp. CACIAM 22H1]KYP15857.1 MAG: hypothetical protein A1D16_10580 [Flavihumibacter sp. CACIAM 22H1]
MKQIINRPIVIGFWIVYFLLIQFVSFGQENPFNEVSIASPNAASLGKFVDAPVNLHTGVPTIGIPIYTIKQGPIELPISLSYHAGGLKVMEPASWVGAGWALTTGGFISRTVQGIPDEAQTGAGPAVNNNMGSHLTNNGYHSYMEVEGVSASPKLLDLNAGRCDGEPDMFSFSFGTYAGKFIFGEDRMPILLPQQDLKIEYVYEAGFNKSIDAFIITTPDGIKYFFGATPSNTDTDPVERTNPWTAINGMNPTAATSAWYLNKVQTHDGVFQILLEYESELYSYPTISMMSLSNSELNSSTKKEYALVKNITYGVRLKKITWTDGEMRFIPGSTRIDLAGTSSNGLNDDEPNVSAKSLDLIEIRSLDSSFCKKIKFNYSYFYDATSPLNGTISNHTINTDRYRLRLDSIQESSCNSLIKIPPYYFEYYTEKVPRRLSFGQDHWGYYNGVINNNTLIASYTLDKYTNVSMANRDANWPAMRGGTLRKIKFPTGGTHEFEMEPHRTWVSYNKYNQTLIHNKGIGFDGSYVPSYTSPYFNFTANSYKITISISSSLQTTNMSATVYLQNTSNSIIHQINVNNSTRSNSLTFEVPPGQYYLYLVMSNRSTGEGCSINLFEMQPYQYEANEIVGGLRILNSKVSEKSGSEIVTNYTYLDGVRSSGILYMRPTYVQVIRNDNLVYVPKVLSNGSVSYELNPCSSNGCESCDFGPTRNYYVSAAPIRPMENTQGQHIGYNEVKVSQVGNGYKIYRFYGSNFWDFDYSDVAHRNVTPKAACSLTIPNFPEAPPPIDFKRGELKYTGSYDNSGNLIETKEIIPEYQSSEIFTPGIISYKLTPPSTFITATEYKIISQKKIRSTEITRKYEIGGHVLSNTVVTDFSSKWHTFPTVISRSSSKGDILKTIRKYSLDFQAPLNEGLSSCVFEYNTAVDAENSNYSSIHAACSTDECRGLARRNHYANLYTIRRNYIDCRKNNFTNSNNTYFTNLVNAKNGGDVELKPIYDLCLNGRNLVIEEQNFKNDLLIGSMYYKQNYSVALPQIVHTENQFSIPLLAPSISFTPVQISGSTLNRDARYELDASLVMRGSSVVNEVKKRGGYAVSYIYDWSNTRVTAEVSGASLSDVAFTSFEKFGVSTDGGWSGTITPFNVTTSNVRTGSYCSTGGGGLAKSGLDPTKTYVVSYWRRSANRISIPGSSGQPYSSSSTPVDGWYFHTQFVNGVSSVVVNFSSIPIDDLRLFPVGASIKTYTYGLGNMITSTAETDGRLNFYEYDQLGRLLRIRDNEGKVVKQFKYEYYNASN